MKEIVVSGIRATGKLHLGNYLGAMRNFVGLQGQYDCFFFVADYHSLTTETNPGQLKTHLTEIVKDYLAIGLDPEKCTIFVQSSVPEVAELSLLLSMVEPAADLEMCPTYKEKKQAQAENVNSGLLFYPILMAADILIQRATLVPVGKDQLPHIQITRDIAERFNARYGEVFPIPQALESRPVRVPGLDGTEKMGKSSHNTIDLVDTPETISRKLAVAVTDTARKRRQDPGNPFKCNIFAIHELVSPEKTISEIKDQCRSAGIGCVECKRLLASKIIELLSPFQEKRKEIEAKPDFVREVLCEGAACARETARQTVEEAREKMGLRHFQGGIK